MSSETATGDEYPDGLPANESLGDDSPGLPPHRPEEDHSDYAQSS